MLKINFEYLIVNLYFTIELRYFLNIGYKPIIFFIFLVRKCDSFYKICYNYY